MTTHDNHRAAAMARQIARHATTPLELGAHSKLALVARHAPAELRQRLLDTAPSLSMTLACYRLVHRRRGTACHHEVIGLDGRRLFVAKPPVIWRLLYPLAPVPP